MFAQGTGNLIAGGITVNPGASPQIAGTAIYAHTTNALGTYAFTVFDALPMSTKPFVVDTAMGAGIAPKAFTFGTVDIFIPTSAGVSYTGNNTGWAWTTGGLASIPIGKTAWRIMPNVRVLKSSVGSNAYQLMGGILIGWGW